jgi:prefoldin subunit 5
MNIPASDDLSEVANALNRVASAVERLSAENAAVHRANRRLRLGLVIALVCLLGGVGYMAFAPLAQLFDEVLQPKLAAVDPERAAAERQRLLAMLPQDRQARIVSFEQHMDWVRRYLNASADFDAGAAVTYFLADMGSSVSVMPAMYAEVRSMNEEIRRIDGEIQAMNTKMQALPVLTTEVQAMNAKMGALPMMANDVQGMHAQISIMAAGMDSTMGRAGRMFPFSW